MKIFSAVPFLLALLPPTSLADKCCWPVDVTYILDDICLDMIDGDQISGYLASLGPTRRQLEVGDGKIVEQADKDTRALEAVDTPSSQHRNLGDMDISGFRQEMFETECDFPYLGKQGPRFPVPVSACDYCIQEPYCLTNSDICAALAYIPEFTIRVSFLPGLDVVAIGIDSMECPSSFTEWDCCVSIDYSITPYLHAALTAFLGSPPPQVIPLPMILGDDAVINFGGATGSIDFQTARLFATLCPLLHGDYCQEIGSHGGMDPHFQTWAGTWYDFHGECDLILIQAPAFHHGVGMEMQVRTTRRYFYSFIEEAVIKIGDDVLSVSSWGGYMLNGVSLASMPAVMANQFPVTHTEISTKEHTFEIEISKRERIIISTFKDFVNFEMVNATDFLFGSSRGLMGDFGTGAMKGRDGVTVFAANDLNSFGQEWQVLDTETSLFQAVRAPQYPQKCTFPAEATTTRRLGLGAVSKQDAEKACGHLRASVREMCVTDVMATGDLDVAQAGAF